MQLQKGNSQSSPLCILTRTWPLQQENQNPLLQMAECRSNHEGRSAECGTPFQNSRKRNKKVYSLIAGIQNHTYSMQMRSSNINTTKYQCSTNMTLVTGQQSQFRTKLSIQNNRNLPVKLAQFTYINIQINIPKKVRFEKGKGSNDP